MKVAVFAWLIFLDRFRMAHAMGFSQYFTQSPT